MTVMPAGGRPNAAAAMPRRPVRVAHLISHPIQYYVPLYRALSNATDIDLTVFYFSDKGLTDYFDPDFRRQLKWDVDMVSGYRAVFMAASKGKAKKPGLLRVPDWSFLKALARGRYDVIWAHGYQDSNVLGAKLITLFQRTVLLVRDDQTLLEPRSFKARTLKRWVFNFLFLGARCGALFTGTNNKAHFRYFGVRESQLFPAFHCVDDAFFVRRASELEPHRQTLRRNFGISDDSPVVLFCGKLIDKKQPLRLLQSFARVVAKQACWLLVAGDGPLIEQARQVCHALKITERVVFAGFLNQSELPDAYAAADIFVLPSSAHETWGLVVNEAMHFSLPVIVSDHVGCAPDLVKDGVNGYVVAAMDTDALTQAIDKLVANKDLRTAFGLQSAALIRDYTVAHCAQQIGDACHALTQRH